MGKEMNDVDSFYLDYSRFKKSLTLTYCYYEIWFYLNKYNKSLEFIEKFELLIIEQAKKEWDDSTNCDFNRNDRIVTIKSTNKNKLKVFDINN